MRVILNKLEITKRYIVLITLLSVSLLLCCCSEADDEPDQPKTETEISILGKKYAIDLFTTQEINPAVKYVYRQLSNTEFPLVIHTIELNRNQSEYFVEAWSGKDSLCGLERPSVIAQRKTGANKNIVAAINGGFYDMKTGMPTTGQIINGLMTKSPDPYGPTVGFDLKNNAFMGIMSLEGQVKLQNNAKNISGLNTDRGANQLILYNSFFGAHTKTNEWGIELMLVPVNGTWENQGNYSNVRCKVESISEKGSMVIPKGHIILSGHGESATYLKQMNVGDEIVVNLKLTQKDGSEPVLMNMIGTHNVILEDGKVIELSLSDAIATGRHPRTAVGYNDKKIFFVVIEGRSETSKGLTAKELSDIFLHIGARNAVNLDGGGSSCMVINQQIKNQLSDGSERAVSDGLFIVSNK